MARKKQELEWYRILLIVIGAFGVVLALVHWYVNGVDIPNGLLTILSLIISAALGPDAVSTVAQQFNKSKQYDTTNTKSSTIIINNEDEEDDTPIKGID